jgi:hypothetical protein
LANLSALEQVMILTFDGKVEVATDFSSDREHLEQIVNALTIGGASAKYTALHDAVYRSVDQLSTLPAGHKAVVLVTDGQDTGSTLLLDDAVRLLERFPVRFYIVGYCLDGLGRSAPEAERVLRRLALISKGRFYSSPRAEDLVDLYRELAVTLRSVYRIEAQVSSESQDGDSHELAVTATVMPGAWALARASVDIPRPPAKERGGVGDTAIVLGAFVMMVLIVTSILLLLFAFRRGKA